MTHSLPDAPALLQAATDYLEEALLPTLSGYHKYQTRVTLHVLRTVARELQLAATAEAGERQRLVALLGHAGELPSLNAELAQALSSGRIPLDSPAVVMHLRQSLQDALAINNPSWIASEHAA